MIVYHGTDSLSAENILAYGIDLKYGNESVDNGRGFYTTPNQAFAALRAKTTAARVKGFHKDGSVKPVVLEIDVEISVGANLKIQTFKGCTYEWKEFIFYNRLGKRFLKKWRIDSSNHNLDCKYDVVIDETADAGVNDLISQTRYADNIHDLTEIIHQIDKSVNPIWDRQISFHSKAAVKYCIKSIRPLDVI